jgi:hypothetical protein
MNHRELKINKTILPMAVIALAFNLGGCNEYNSALCIFSGAQAGERTAENEADP